MPMGKLHTQTKLKLRVLYDFNKFRRKEMRKMITKINLGVLLLLLSGFHIHADALKDSYTQEYNGNFEASYKLMESLVTEKPNEYLYQYRAGWVAYIGGHFSQSLVHYARAIVIDQSSLEPRVAQLKPLMALGKFREVETTCKSILQLDPKNYIAKSTLAYSLYNSGDFQTALKYYIEVLRDYPSDIEMLLGVGWTQLKLGKKDKSMEAFQKAERINPWNERVLEGLRYSR